MHKGVEVEIPARVYGRGEVRETLEEREKGGNERGKSMEKERR